MSDELQEQAAALLEHVQADGGEGKHSHLTPDERALILILHAREVPQAEIARIIGCHPSSVSRTVRYLDTRDGARLMLHQGAAKLADKVLRTKSAETARKALTQIDVLPKDGSGTSVDVRVMLGIQTTDEERRAMVPNIAAGVAVAVGHGDDTAA